MTILKKYQKFIFVIVFSCVLLSAAYIRYEGITTQGVQRGDSFKYIDEANLWAEGNPPKFLYGNFYRPVFYLFQSLSIRTLGYKDYSAKVFNVSADMLNICLMCCILFLLTKKKWLCIILISLYAFNPFILLYVRGEFPHTLSTTFVLFSLLFYILYELYQKNRVLCKLLLFIAGLFVGMAANTHVDLAFLGPGYIFCLLLAAFQQRKNSNPYVSFFSNSFIFSIGFILPYVIGIIALGFSTVIDVFFKEITSSSEVLNNRYEKITFSSFFSIILQHCSGGDIKNKIILLSLPLTAPIPAVIVFRRLSEKKDELICYISLILIVSYLILYLLFVGVFPLNYLRMLLPLSPVFLIMIIVWYFKFFKMFSSKYGILFVLIVFSFGFYHDMFYLPNQKYPQSKYRYIYDVLNSKVDSKNKVLIAPAAVYSFDDGFKVDLYFGRNAVYLAHMPLKETYTIKTLTKIIESNTISYIFISKRIDKRLLNPDFPLGPRERHKVWFRRKDKPYSLEKDLEIIQTYLCKNGMLIDSNRFGEIYYLTNKKQSAKKTVITQRLVTHMSFEQWKNGLPVGMWYLQSGEISRSNDVTDGSSSIKFENKSKNNDNGTRIICIFKQPFSCLKDFTLRIKVDVKARKSDLFTFLITATLDGKRQAIKPGSLKYNGKGDWKSLSQDYVITDNMEKILFHLWLRNGATGPAFVDNFSAEIVN